MLPWFFKTRRLVSVSALKIFLSLLILTPLHPLPGKRRRTQRCERTVKSTTDLTLKVELEPEVGTDWSYILAEVQGSLSPDLGMRQRNSDTQNVTVNLPPSPHHFAGLSLSF